jgi:hypothetical protein
MTAPRHLYLQALFAACPGGASAAQIALWLGDRPEEAQAVIDALWRERMAARVPNPRGKGVVWRSALKADGMAGFLYESDGEPYRVIGGKPTVHVAQKKRVKG